MKYVIQHISGSLHSGPGHKTRAVSAQNSQLIVKLKYCPIDGITLVVQLTHRLSNSDATIVYNLESNVPIIMAIVYLKSYVRLILHVKAD